MEREEKYRTLFERSPLSITLADKTGVILDCNRLTEEITGYTKEDLVGKRFEELATIDSKDYPMLRKKLENISKGHEDTPYELEIKGKDAKSRWLLVLNSPLMKDNEVTGLQIIANDITERKSMEKALRDSA